MVWQQLLERELFGDHAIRSFEDPGAPRLGTDAHPRLDAPRTPLDVPEEAAGRLRDDLDQRVAFRLALVARPFLALIPFACQLRAAAAS